MLEINKTHNIDALSGLRQLPDNCIDCCVTSPSYWRLRDYQVENQLGLEETPELYVQKVVEIFSEVKRVLKPTGTLWINLGDSYAGSYKGSNTDGIPHISKLLAKQGTNRGSIYGLAKPTKAKNINLKPKDLVGIPWRIAFALQTDGWYLRQDIIEEVELYCPCGCGYILEERIWRYSQDRDIIWSKPNPMPESVTDRCTKSHEYIFLLSKSKEYYFDQDSIRQPLKDTSINRLSQDIENQKGSDRVPGKTNGNFKASAKGFDKSHGGGGSGFKGHSGNYDRYGNLISATANKKSVWTVTTQPFKDAHFATFPEKLIVDCIKAGSSEFGCCAVCGKPYSRIVEKELVPTKKASYNSTVDDRDINSDKNDQGSNRQKDMHKPGWANKIKTKGWHGCNCGEIIPSLILDPFMGSGTTAIVSRKLNRNYIGFEINPKYIKIQDKRMYEELGMYQ